VALSSFKSQKFRIFGKNLPLGDESPSAIFTKLGVEEGVSGLPPHAKFDHRGFGNVRLSLPKSSKYGLLV